VRRQRVVVIFVMALLCFSAVLVRLVRLQVAERDMWSRESERSSARYVARSFSRGWILDRNGQPLAASEEAHDLVFTYRDWRRSSVAGQAAYAWWTLLWDDASGERPTVSQAYAHLDRGVEALGAVSLGAISDILPRQRRLDFGFYITRLFGRDVWDELRNLLAADELLRDVPLSHCEGFAAGLARCQQRAIREALALADLGRVTELPPGDLVQIMDGAAARVMGMVRQVEARSAVAERVDALNDGQDASDEPTLREIYRRRQELNAAFDGERVTIVESVPYDTTTLVAIRGRNVPGFRVETEDRRIYPPAVADVATLLVGQIGKPQLPDTEPAQAHRIELADLSSLEDLTAEELTRYEELVVAVRETDYRPDEERGSIGLELAFEAVLRGRRGWETEVIDDRTTHRDEREPLRGLDVTLTLDVSLQRAAEQALDVVYRRAPNVPDQAPDSPRHWMGSVVMLDPRTGHILVAASGPRPTREQLNHDYDALLADKRNAPMRQRAFDPGATGNLPPPGSTFKPAVALAALKAGVIGEQTTFFCEGKLAVGNRTMGCLGYHGDIAVAEAVARSCNIFFYHAGRLLGMEPLLELVEAVGFGARTGIVQRNENLAGLGVPVGSGVHEARSPVGAGPYTSTDAMRLAIGQAPLDDVTPLQVAAMMGAIGTGSWVPPQLIASVEGYGDVASRPARSLDMQLNHLRIVREAMADVVDRSYGTANDLLSEFPEIGRHVAAKTGTAQVGGGRDHSWFAGYLPRDNPRLAFAVIIEDCGFHGAEAALPVFMALLDSPAMAAYLDGEVLP
jgi:cell division protein FtsI/penicillin-binding protein 2